MEKLFVRENILTFFYIVILLAIGRLIPHPHNFTPILAAAIVVPYFINNKFLAIMIPLLAMFISDLFIGLHSGIFWIYGAIACSTLISDLTKNISKKYLHLGSMTLVSSLVFYFITNFGTWLFCPCNPVIIDGQMLWEFYPKNLDGFILNYTLALPFFKNSLMSTILYTALFVVMIDLSKNTFLKLSFVKTN